MSRVKTPKFSGHMEDNLRMRTSDVLRIMQRRIVNKTSYFGIHTTKCPLDMWVYQEILFEVKPDWLIEIGTGQGGATLAFAHLFDQMCHGNIISIDVNHGKVAAVTRRHHRIHLMQGNAIDHEKAIKELIRYGSVLVIEDSSHTYDNTLAVLRAYSPLVSKGSYFIVEDGNCHHGLRTGPNPGPYEAVESFIAENDAFEIDRGRESFFITWNPKGYLKRRR